MLNNLFDLDRLEELDEKHSSHSEQNQSQRKNMKGLEQGSNSEKEQAKSNSTKNRALLNMLDRIHQRRERKKSQKNIQSSQNHNGGMDQINEQKFQNSPRSHQTKRAARRRTNQSESRSEQNMNQIENIRRRGNNASMGKSPQKQDRNSTFTDDTLLKRSKNTKKGHSPTFNSKVEQQSWPKNQNEKQINKFAQVHRKTNLNSKTRLKNKQNSISLDKLGNQKGNKFENRKSQNKNLKHFQQRSKPRDMRKRWPNEKQNNRSNKNNISRKKELNSLKEIFKNKISNQTKNTKRQGMQEEETDPSDQTAGFRLPTGHPIPPPPKMPPKKKKRRGQRNFSGNRRVTRKNKKLNFNAIKPEDIGRKIQENGQTKIFSRQTQFRNKMQREQKTNFHQNLSENEYWMKNNLSMKNQNPSQQHGNERRNMWVNHNHERSQNQYINNPQRPEPMNMSAFMRQNENGGKNNSSFAQMDPQPTQNNQRQGSNIQNYPPPRNNGQDSNAHPHNSQREQSKSQYPFNQNAFNTSSFNPFTQMRPMAGNSPQNNNNNNNNYERNQWHQPQKQGNSHFKNFTNRGHQSGYQQPIKNFNQWENRRNMFKNFQENPNQSRFERGNFNQNEQSNNNMREGNIYRGEPQDNYQKLHQAQFRDEKRKIPWKMNRNDYRSQFRNRDDIGDYGNQPKKTDFQNPTQTIPSWRKKQPNINVDEFETTNTHGKKPLENFALPIQAKKRIQKAKEKNIPEINPQIRDEEIFDNLEFIEMMEPVKDKIIKSLMERSYSQMQLIRKMKKIRYMGSVTFGIIMYNLRELFGEDMIIENIIDGRKFFALSPRFKALCKRAYSESEDQNN